MLNKMLFLGVRASENYNTAGNCKANLQVFMSKPIKHDMNGQVLPPSPIMVTKPKNTCTHNIKLTIFQPLLCVQFNSVKSIQTIKSIKSIKLYNESPELFNFA